MITIKSRSHDYTVEEFESLAAALATAGGGARTCYLVDQVFAGHYQEVLKASIPADGTIYVEATEPQKSLEAMTPLFLEVLKRSLKRDGVLVVIGGGVLQDIGCFIASVLFRGLRWELVPTTLLAQADSCIGSKSSINVGPYKNQVGTFYPPHRVLLTPQVLGTLPWDEIRSGLGEVIKLQLLAGEEGFRELMRDLQGVKGHPEILLKWVYRSLEVKKPYIETDEFDRGIRNLLNYGHTFGHAFESATHYGIPHGIGVVLGMLAATSVSAQLGLAKPEHFQELKALLAPWHEPYATVLRNAPREEIFQAIRHDKKNTGQAVNCILTRGFARMEKAPLPFAEQLVPAVNFFIDRELAGS
jgi:3-dehydroquinate synthase